MKALQSLSQSSADISAVVSHDGSHQSSEDCLHPRSPPHLPGVGPAAQYLSLPVFLRYGGGQHCVPGKEKYSEIHAAVRI